MPDSIASLDSVSLCIPVYNGAPYLAAALASARAQDHARLEILVVDDGSTDDSVAVAQAAAEQDARIRCVRNPVNLGLVGNWNRCVELAEGRWLKFLFQDDLLEPDCVSALMARAADGWRFVACDREFIVEHDAGSLDVAGFHANRAAVRAFLAPEGGCSAAAFRQRSLHGLHHNLVGEPTVTLIERALMRSTGPFNAALVQLCDTEYWLRLGCQAGVGFVDRPLAHFRVHGGAATARNTRGTRFVSDSLDKLALARTAALDPACASLRSVAATASGRAPTDLRKAFDDRAHAVHEWVRLHADEPCGAGTVQQAYAHFLDRCPEARVAEAAHLMWRCRRGLSALRHAMTP